MRTYIALLIVTSFTVATQVCAHDSPDTAALFTRLDLNADGQLANDEIAAEHQRLFARLLRTGDADGDGVLTAHEFTAALTPSRPEKPIEQEQDADFPGAKATRWLLLTLDADGDSRITSSEVPKDFKRVFDRLVNQIDRDDDGVLNRGEINRGGPRLARQAVQTAQRMEINVDREVAKLTKKQGDRAGRFDAAPNLRQALTDPSNAREIFARLDANGDGYVVVEELPEQARQRLARPFRRVDANRDGRLSRQEFSTLARRLGTLTGFMERRSDTKPKP